MIMGKEIKPLYAGQVFGRLTVIGKDEKKSKETGRIHYFCQCECGSPVKSIWKASLLDKKKPTLSCGCIVREKAGFISDRSIALKKLLYIKMKDRHVNQLNDVEETFIAFDSFVAKCDEPCYYCGKEKTSFLKDRRTNYILEYNGLDRLNSNMGYREENTVAACKFCNIAKAEMSVDEFRDFLVRIHKHQFGGEV